jgi:hypothetical protein
MNKQITLSAFSDELANVRAKKKEFLAQIDHIVPWGEWAVEIKSCYYKGERRNKPYDLELMPRIYMPQNLYETVVKPSISIWFDCMIALTLKIGFRNFLKKKAAKKHAYFRLSATATVAPTMGLLPMPRKPIISTWAGTEEEPANWASECIQPMVSVMP